MTTAEDGREPVEGRRPLWPDRVAVSETGAPFAFVPGRVLVRGELAGERAETLTGRSPEERTDLRPDRETPLWVRVTGIEDPLAVVRVLRSEGLDAQPEQVFFSHGCGGGCEEGPHPAFHHAVASGELGADPYRANPYRANPYRANPYRANPYRANPYRANPYRANEAPSSTAEPAAGRALPDRPVLQGGGRHPRIVVLDTGVAGPDGSSTLRPALLDKPEITGDLDRPDADIEGLGGQVFPADGYLDPVAGHGTFIAGLIEQLAGGCTIRVQQVVGPLGDVQELDVVAALEALSGLPPQDRPDMVVMSFGGPALGVPKAFQEAVDKAAQKGIVLVASAGNDGTCIRQYPAAFESVVGVAAVGPEGAPPWTNYGEWVDACAPGVEMVSAFFRRFDGPFPMMNTVDIDEFAEWALWSGTSFSAPVVAAALAREMVVGDCDAGQAVARVVRAPHLLRLPCLGTVVNF